MKEKWLGLNGSGGLEFGLPGKQEIESSIRREIFLNHLLNRKVSSAEGIKSLESHNIFRTGLFASWNEAFGTRGQA